MKYIMIVPDGLTDLPVRELGLKTPLEKAEIPFIDRMLREGRTGALKTVPDGHEPGSDVANLSLLGVNPERIRIGRGALEALSQNLKIKKNETVMRVNFVTLAGDTMADNTAGNIKSSQARYLIRELNRKIKGPVRFYSGVGYRNLAVISRSGLRLRTVPPHDILGKSAGPYLPQGRDRKVILDLMKRANAVLADSILVRTRKVKANAVWFWGEGHPVHTDSFFRKYGLKGAVISAVDIIRGIARLLKMDVIDVPGITGGMDTSFRNKALYALKNLKKYDFILIHVEATDEAGHKGDYREKIRAVELIDRDIVRTLLDAPEKFTVILLPDHPTPVSCRTHINKEVPFILYAKTLPGKAKNAFHKFRHYSEKILEDPPVFISSGHTFLDRILKDRIFPGSP